MKKIKRQGIDHISPQPQPQLSNNKIDERIKQIYEELEQLKKEKAQLQKDREKIQKEILQNKTFIDLIKKSKKYDKGEER